jgi:hypothetical protein
MDDFERLLHAAFPGLNEAGAQPPLLTDVLSLVDHMIVTGTTPAPGLLPDDLDRLRDHLDHAVLRVVEKPIDDSAAAATHDLVSRFAQYLLGDRSNPISLVTTNYDIGLEQRIYERLGSHHREEIDFGFSWRLPGGGGRLIHRLETPRLRILKLHGSANWLRCRLCQHVYINTHGPIYRLAYRTQIDDTNTCECGHGPLRALIVGPSFVSEVADGNLLSIWNAAVDALRTSNEWYIVGYSLPSEDVAIRSVFVRAYRSSPRPPKVRVVLKGESSDVTARYRFLFPNCEFEFGGFEALLAAHGIGAAT